MSVTRWSAIVFLAIVAVLAASASVATADESLRILTYPTGLVVGEQKVEVDLGPEGLPANLFLDGAQACTMTAAAPECTVDLGPDLHVHLLELVRDDTRAERWINRPGQEAELTLQLTPPGAKRCGARIDWVHPEQQNPVELQVTLDSEPLEFLGGRAVVEFPCPSSESSQVLAAAAVFPDGRRVETVRVMGGFTGETAVELTAVPLVAEAEGAPPCAAGGIWPAGVERFEDSAYEVVLVLDPGASYQNLYTSGWHAGRLPTLDVTVKAFDTMVQHGAEDSAPKPKNSWLKANRTLFDAERLWYVAPDANLSRVNGLGAGRPNWLKLLIKFGLTDLRGNPRISDAVAASGLVAGAGPRRRAVILVLGNNVRKRDQSMYTPQQAREYLAEVQVPLVVFRNAKPKKEDGWPVGLLTLDMEAMSRNLRAVRDLVDRQCIGWFPPTTNPSQLATTLPAGVRLAGRGEDAPESSESVWARAEIEATEPELPTAGEIIADRLDITAVTVVVSAVDDKGRPVTDLTAADVTVSEDGSPVEVLGLAPLPTHDRAGEETAAVDAIGEETDDGDTAPTPAQALPVAVYVDRTLGGGSDLRSALRAVAGEAERLTAVGPVEVVVAEKQQVRTLAGPTRDPAAVGAALAELAKSSPGVHAIERIRRRFMLDIRQIPDRVTAAEVEDGESSAGTLGSRIAFAARTAVGEEEVVLSRAIERLGLWAQRETGHRAGLLMVVGAGFDEDPTPFYIGFVDKLEPHNSSQVRAELIQMQQAVSVGALGRELAGTGWRILGVAGQSTASDTFGADSRTDKFATFLSASSDAIRASDPEFMMLDPIGAQRHLAAASGGDVAVGKGGLRRALDETSGWYQLTYQVARAPDGKVHQLAVETGRAGVKLVTSDLVTAATSEGQAEARARRLLGGADDFGELPVELEIAPPAETERLLTAEVEAVLHLSEFAPVLRQTRTGMVLRVSVAVAAKGAEPTVIHRLEQLENVPPGWIYAFPVQWPAGPGSRLSVTVEDLASGLWGGAVVDLPAGP
ncbi:MAG: hypothetical protein V3T72_17010 [Thermoanaerobaculia bacterium]